MRFIFQVDITHTIYWPAFLSLAGFLRGPSLRLPLRFSLSTLKSAFLLSSLFYPPLLSCRFLFLPLPFILLLHTIYGFSSRPYSFPPFLHPLSRFLPFPSVITSSPYLPSVLRRLLCHCRTYVVTSSDLCVRFLLCASVVSFFVHALLLTFIAHALLLTFIAHATRKIDYKTTK